MYEGAKEIAWRQCCRYVSLIMARDQGELFRPIGLRALSDVSPFSECGVARNAKSRDVGYTSFNVVVANRADLRYTIRLSIVEWQCLHIARRGEVWCSELELFWIKVDCKYSGFNKNRDLPMGLRSARQIRIPQDCSIFSDSRPWVVQL